MPKGRLEMWGCGGWEPATTSDPPTASVDPFNQLIDNELAAAPAAAEKTSESSDSSDSSSSTLILGQPRTKARAKPTPKVKTKAKAKSKGFKLNIKPGVYIEGSGKLQSSQEDKSVAGTSDGPSQLQRDEEFARQLNANLRGLEAWRSGIPEADTCRRSDTYGIVPPPAAGDIKHQAQCQVPASSIKHQAPASSIKHNAKSQHWKGKAHKIYNAKSQH